jgi:hypothetical protein
MGIKTVMLVQTLFCFKGFLGVFHDRKMHTRENKAGEGIPVTVAIRLVRHGKEKINSAGRGKNNRKAFTGQGKTGRRSTQTTGGNG